MSSKHKRSASALKVDSAIKLPKIHQTQPKETSHFFPVLSPRKVSSKLESRMKTEPIEKDESFLFPYEKKNSIEMP